MNNLTTTDPQEALRSTMEQLVAAMCERPDHATVNLVPSSRRPVLVVKVNRCDYGAVLGKYKSSLESLQLIARCIGSRSRMDVDLMLDQDAVEDGSRRRNFIPAKDWDREPFEKLAELTLAELFGSYQTDIQRTASSSSRLTVTVTDPAWAVGEETVGSLERALETVFNCVGALQGQRITVEVVA